MAVNRLGAPGSTKTRPPAPPVIHARLGAGIRLDQAELTPALLAAFKHAASMPNPLFYERQRRRISTWGVPRFLQSFDETLDGGLILPRGLRDTVASLAEQAGSRLEVTDGRATGDGAGVHVHGDPDRRAGGSRRRTDPPRPGCPGGATGSG